MSTHTQIRRQPLSPGFVAIVGLILMAAAFVVDLSTDPTSAHAVTFSASAAEQPAS